MLVSLALLVASACAAPGTVPTSTMHPEGPGDLSRAAIVMQAAHAAVAPSADQAYLRALADALEAERISVHTMMSEPAGDAAHGGTMDPADWDNALDALQREALALLKHDYGETLSPSAARHLGTTTAVGSQKAMSSEAPGADADQHGMRDLVSIMRETIALSRQYTPRLRRASTRDLARRVRKSQDALLKQLAGITR